MACDWLINVANMGTVNNIFAIISHVNRATKFSMLDTMGSKHTVHIR